MGGTGVGGNYDFMDRPGRMIDGNKALEALPVAVYTTDAEGRITFYNEAAATLWGRRPELGTSFWCGSAKLFWPDGREMALEECPMAVSLREGVPVRGVEAVAERPDGSRVPFIPHPTPIRDDQNRITGGINLLLDISDRDDREIESARLAAIVSSSDDAIVSKTLDGIIRSWNAGAERIFGYSAEEMIGSPIFRIIPAHLHDEETQILAKLRRGERIEHFDTVRLAKDGRRVDVSLTVSPLRDRLGNIVGASKIARDVTDRKRAEELQNLLFQELNHRVKNTLATIQALAGQSLRRAPTPAAFVSSFNGRIQALGRAHDLLVQGKMQGSSLAEVVREQVLPGDDPRISIDGPSVTLNARAAVQLALVLHELASNARKHGALSVVEGRLAIRWHTEASDGSDLVIDWTEKGLKQVAAPAAPGFGAQLIERTLEGDGGSATIHYNAGGISCHIRLPLPEASAQDIFTAALTPQGGAGSAEGDDRSSMNGKRILLIEDEALVAMEIESELLAAGCVVVGPAGNIASAQRLIEEAEIDAALVDANLAGRPVDELAAALTSRGVPFAFATGYGRDGLPRDFQDSPMLTKPFSREQMLETVKQLLATPAESGNVVRLKR
ncbi:MAG TPA: PAS domain S-box protein [Devosiaceae bacterium]|nr:PAS domain S-box protein [Devosiaceae bacterium]